MDKEIDVFLCYRRAGAQTAKLFKRYLDDQDFVATVWYSDDEPSGNYKHDTPSLIGEAKSAVLFIDKNFVDGFIGEQKLECITKLEIVEMARKLLTDSSFKIVPVYLDREVFTEDEQKILLQLFENYGLDSNKCLEKFGLSNSTPFDTARDYEWDLFKKIKDNMLPHQFYESLKNYGNFYFGTIPTTVDIIYWDVEHGIDAKNISFTLQGKDPVFYNTILRIDCDMPEIKQNNQMLSVLGADCILTDNEERKCLTIKYTTIEYRLFFKTLQLWNSSRLKILEKISGNSERKYSEYDIPNAMGMAFFVVTCDKKLIFTKRSSKRGIRPNEYDCSIVEGLKIEGNRQNGERYDIDNEDYIEQEIFRAYREEICSDDNNLNYFITGIVFDRNYGQWNFIGTIYSDMTADDLLKLHSVRADTFEGTTIEAVSIVDENKQPTLKYVEESMRKFMRTPMWGMALTSLYATLRLQGFSDSDIYSLNIVN